MAKAFGAYGAVQGLAAAAGPLLGGFLVDADLGGLGWRTIFWVNVPVAVVALVAGGRFLPESSAFRRTALDLTGVALSAAAVLLILLPLVQGMDWGWPWWGFALMAAGVAVMGAFLRHERRRSRPSAARRCWIPRCWGSAASPWDCWRRCSSSASAASKPC